MKLRLVAGRDFLLLGGFALTLLPSGLTAQEGADFLFRRPRVSLSLRAGYSMPRAGSEVFDFAREQLTVETSDFAAPALQGEIAVRVADRWDVAAGFGWAESSADSEFRDWIGTDNLPILQTTRFSRAPLTLSVKGYLTSRGRSFGRFAWVPARWAPYLGAGAGAVSYEFEQTGEFVDYQTLDIFSDRFLSRGWAPTAHLFGGLDFSLGRYFLLTGEGRYAWGSTKLGTDFVDFDEIDLSGFQGTVGLSLRF